MDFLVIDDDKTFRDATVLLIEMEGHYAEAASTGELGLARLQEDKFNGVLLDLNLGQENGLDVLQQILKRQPNLPVVIFTAQSSVKSAVEAMRRGALDFLEKPFSHEQFHTVLARVRRFHELSQSIKRLEEEVTESKTQTPEPFFDFAAPRMRAVMELLERAASTPASILLTGESGTGKSIIARAVHAQSQARHNSFVTVSCPSLSRELLESDLFGHVKGSFTGAVKDHWGKVKLANGGTLFLDEIGDLPLEIQPKLLRLLEEREYERIGDNVTRPSTARVIAATSRDLKKRVAEGLFREDLYFRLNVIAVEMPPLRERPEDLIRFASHYLSHFARTTRPGLRGFSDDATTALLAYGWPGNLRELRNAVERAVIMGRAEMVTAADLPIELNSTLNPQEGQPSCAATGSLISMEQMEEAHLRGVLNRTASLAEAARVLGIDQATLYRKRKKIGLE